VSKLFPMNTVPQFTGPLHSIFLDWAGNVSNFPRESRNLAGAFIGKAEQANRRSDALEKRRQSAAYCEPGTQGNVVRSDQ
jgi:hypothetical protein